MALETPFHPRTAALCKSLRFKQWAGYHAVSSYDDHHDPEYFAFRNATGLLDVSPLFKYEVTGADGAEFLSYVSTRNIRGLATGRVTYACFCDREGKVIDDGTIARLGDRMFRVTSASPLFGWFERNRRGFEVSIEDESARTAALALQGPTSGQVLAEMVGSAIGGLKYFGIASARIEGVEVQISRTGYTGDLGYEIWIPAEGALDVWDAVMEAGKPYGLLPAGLDALDVTRIEAGFVLQDVDYFSAPRCLIESRKSTPFEIGLGWTVDLKREPFLGQRCLSEEEAAGSRWKLVGLEVSWPGLEALYDEYGLPPNLAGPASRSPVPVFTGIERQVGQVTSSAWSPILKKYLALASVRAEHANQGADLRVEHTVEFERRAVEAMVVARPFFDPERKRA